MSGMHRWIRAGCLIVVACTVATAGAQEEKKDRPGRGRGFGFGGGMFGGGSSVMLAGNPEVVKLLKLSDEERAFVKLLIDDASAQREKLFAGGGFQDLSEDERRQRFETMRKQQQDQEKQLGEIIGEQKMTRLRQVGLQLAGVMAAFMNPEIGEKLALTDDQRQKSRETFESGRDQMREIFQSAQGDPEAMRKGMQEFNKKQSEELAKILTDEQKKKWAELQGESVGEESLAKIRDAMQGPGGGFFGRAGGPRGDGKARKRPESKKDN